MVIFLHLVCNILLHEILCILCDLIKIKCKWQMIDTGGDGSGDGGGGGMAAALSILPESFLQFRCHGISLLNQLWIWKEYISYK